MGALDLSWRSGLLLAVSTPALAAGIALALRDVERKAGLFLLGFIAAALLSVTPQVIGFSGFYGRWPGLTFAPFAAELYLPGLFFAHASALMRGHATRLWLWLLPGFVQTAYFTAAFLGFEDYRAKWAYNDAVHEPYIVPIETATSLGLTIAALIATTRLLERYRAYLDATESVEALFDPRWIAACVRWVVAITLLWGGLQLTSLLIAPVSYVDGYAIHLAVMTLFSGLAVAALAGIREPFPKLGAVALDEAVPPPASANPGSETKRENTQAAADAGPGASGVPTTDPGTPATADADPGSDRARNWAALGAQLEARLRDECWYTEPRLSIRDVARRMGTNETYVSRALNDGLGVTFKACVHGMRVEHAKRQLRDSDEPVLSVGLDAGFSSKSTFNRVFRDVAGLTPTAYRTSQVRDSGSQSPN
ncbi:MAG: AraC family transcriptional regulator [Myxococcota bacterium]